MTHSKIILYMIEITKQKKCDWIRIDVLKDYLRTIDMSLNDIEYLHSYLRFLQTERFIFDCRYTYVTVYNRVIYAFSKNKYSYNYRLDILSFDSSKSSWNKISSTKNLLLRLRNAITITDDNNDYESFIASISQCNSV